jgi:integrase
MISLIWEQFSGYLFDELDLDKKQSSNYKSRFFFICQYFLKDRVLQQDIELTKNDLATELNENNLKNFRKHLGHIKNKPSTKNCYLDSMRKVCTWLKGDDYKKILHDFPNRQDPKIPLDEDEQQAVVKRSYEINYRYGVIIETELRTGLRRSEIRNLRWDDYMGNILIIRSENSKNKLGREIIIAKDLSEKINKLPRYSHGYIFGGPRGPLGKDTINQFLQIVKKDTGIRKPLHNHILRHSVGTSLADEGVNQSVIKAFMGHKCIQTTDKYIHPSFKTLSRAEKKLPLAKTSLDKNNVLEDFDELAKKYKETSYYPRIEEARLFLVKMLYQQNDTITS